MISISEAFRVIDRQIKKFPSEKIKINDSCGRILAENISADMDLPPFDRSQMDGFAVRTEDIGHAPVKLKIIGESVAGKGFDGQIKSGETIRIMTGARLPKGADSVQKKELARVFETENTVEILEATKPQQNYVIQAAEIKKGIRVFSKGELINAQMIAVLASFGYAQISVYRQPKVSVLATGSEIVAIDETPQRDQIRDSNSISLKTFAEQTGAKVKVLPRIRDDLKNLKKAIEKAAQKSDILILSGGVSVGDYDFTKPALHELGAKVFFEKIALRPGKPTVFARLGECFIFGLPGNPVSVAVTFFLFVRRAILQMQGANRSNLREGWAVLAKSAKGAKERDSYLPAESFFTEDARLTVAPLGWTGSSDFVSFSKADCLVFVPRGEKYEAGAVVKVLFLR